MFRMISAKGKARAERYYTSCLHHAKPGSRPQETVGQWRGLLAGRLELQGKAVTQDVLTRLCSNRHPTSAGPLTLRTKKNRRVLYDCSFHVPKGVSLLALLSDQPEIITLVLESALATVGEAEKEARTRLRKGGIQDGSRVSGNLLWFDAIHLTSRPVQGVPDPNLHIHAVILNASWDPVEAQLKAAELLEMKRRAPYYEAVFHAGLTLGLARLGYNVERKGRWWDVAGLSDSLKMKFCRRSEVIRAHRAAKPRAANSTLATREEKTHDPIEQLLPEWRDRLTRQEEKALGAVLAKVRTGDSIEDLLPEWHRRMSPAEKQELEEAESRARKRRLTSEPALMTAEEALDQALRIPRLFAGPLTRTQAMTQALWIGLGRIDPRKVEEEMANRTRAFSDPEVESDVEMSI